MAMIVWMVAACAASFLGSYLYLSQDRDAVAKLQLKAKIQSIPFVARKAEARRLQKFRLACLSQMPEFIDIVALGLSAGLSFDAALSLYCEKFSTELSDVFKHAQMKWQMGITSRQDALLEVGEELDLQVMTRFSVAVVEALEFGAPLSVVLEQQSAMLRQDQKAQVEEEIEKVPIKMLIPLGVLIVPAMLLAILGPLLAGALKTGF